MGSTLSLKRHKSASQIKTRSLEGGSRASRESRSTPLMKESLKECLKTGPRTPEAASTQTSDKRAQQSKRKDNAPEQRPAPRWDDESFSRTVSSHCLAQEPPDHLSASLALGARAKSLGELTFFSKRLDPQAELNLSRASHKDLADFSLKLQPGPLSVSQCFREDEEESIDGSFFKHVFDGRHISTIAEAEEFCFFTAENREKQSWRCDSEYEDFENGSPP